jgi:hypothetical protein
MTRLRPACRLPLLVVLLLSITLSTAMAAGEADGAMPAPDNGVWLPLIVIGLVVIMVIAGVLVYSFRRVRAFEENTSSLIDALRILIPMPVVTLSDKIPDGMDGRLEVRIAGFSFSTLGQVTVIIAPPSGLALENNYITLPHLDSGETKTFWIGHGRSGRGSIPSG